MATAHRLVHQPAELKRVFEEYDSDQDARLTLEEFARLVKDCMYYFINSCSIKVPWYPSLIYISINNSVDEQWRRSILF